MVTKSTGKQLPVRGRIAGSLEVHDEQHRKQLERIAQALRSFGDEPMARRRAHDLVKRFGVHRATIYRYRARLAEIDEATAIAGRTRG